MAKQKQIEIIDRVNRMDKVDWKKMLSIRNEDLKKHTEQQLEKLEQSLIHNGFIEPFAAWQDPKTKDIYTINGHTRKKRLLSLIEKGYSIPDTLSAFFIDCKNLNDAASVLPLYESKYGTIDSTKLDEFKITFDLDETKVVGSTLDIFSVPIDHTDLLNEFFQEPNKEMHTDNKEKILLEYTKEDYNKVMDALKKHSGSKEQIIYKLLGL